MVSLEKHASWCFEVAYHPSNPSGVHIVGTQQEKNCNDQNLRTKCFLYSPKNWIYINRHQALPKQHSTCNHVKNYPSDLWHFGSSQSQQGRSQSPRLHGFTRMFHLVIGANLSWQNKNHGHFFSVLLLISSHFFNPFFVSICKSYVFSFVRPEPPCLHAEYIQNQSLRCMAQTVS